MSFENLAENQLKIVAEMDKMSGLRATFQHNFFHKSQMSNLDRQLTSQVVKFDEFTDPSDWPLPAGEELDRLIRCPLSRSVATPFVRSVCNAVSLSSRYAQFVVLRACIMSCERTMRPKLLSLVGKVIKVEKRNTSEFSKDSNDETVDSSIFAHPPILKSTSLEAPNESENPLNTQLSDQHSQRPQGISNQVLTDILPGQRVSSPIDLTGGSPSRVHRLYNRGATYKSLSSSSNTFKRVKKPKVVYSMMKESALRALLRKEGLPEHGDKAIMSKRHGEFINRYNANVDATNPKSTHELISDLKNWEKVLRNDRMRRETAKILNTLQISKSVQFALQNSVLAVNFIAVEYGEAEIIS
ncbi:hypothetical protein G9A89_005213 [Geosiphon pyriformis]|nr:hypothetical protein G9A89_005213 [Geosiphon pyriformis]